VEQAEEPFGLFLNHHTVQVSADQGLLYKALLQ
jgi:hypothetical protein